MVQFYFILPRDVQKINPGWRLGFAPDGAVGLSSVRKPNGTYFTLPQGGSARFGPGRANLKPGV
ncbi:MAG: hypothetical protein Rhob2KO_51410 [Rhodopirellula baltica]